MAELLEIEILETRDYVGYGLFHVGEVVHVPQDAGEQFIAQGFAKLAKQKRPGSPILGKVKQLVDKED
ncbi:hypothetical protein C4564_02120 [Candidatus Microgenomates bacterium]|nr:MAG: hypothetical protein C4564_02120 [Candidatus Microgenomates bacterium]